MTNPYRERCRQRYRDRIAEGICPNCGCNPIKPGRKRCEGCLEDTRRAAKRRVDERAAAGLCVRCGKAPATETSRTCRPCLEKQSAYNSRRPRPKPAGTSGPKPKPDGTPCLWCGKRPRPPRRKTDGRLPATCRVCSNEHHRIAHFLRDHPGRVPPGRSRWQHAAHIVLRGEAHTIPRKLSHPLGPPGSTPPPGTRWCHGCKAFFPLDRFHRMNDPRRKMLHAPLCKPCRNLAVADRLAYRQSLSEDGKWADGKLWSLRMKLYRARKAAREARKAGREDAAGLAREARGLYRRVNDRLIELGRPPLRAPKEKKDDR